MASKMFEKEIEVMSVLWGSGEEMKACDIVKVLEYKGWSYSTAYTMVRRCVKKGYIERIDPGFVCRPLISKGEAYIAQSESLFDRFFPKPNWYMAAFSKAEGLNEYDRAKIQEMFDKFDKELEEEEKSKRGKR